MSIRDWEIIYSSAEGVELRAMELLYGEVGNCILRDQGVYGLHVLTCRKADRTLPEKNAFVIGTPEENPLLRRFIRDEEIPANGYRIRIIANPEQEGRQLVLIAGKGACEVLYGVTAFVDELLIQFAPADGDGIHFRSRVFEQPLPETDLASAPETLVRSIFSWAHPMGDYRQYLKNMARMRINRMYFWNEYPPVNAAEIVEYAHSWGIEIYWGFAWGWSTNCMEGAVKNLESLRDGIMKEWHDVWSKLPGDGIYFQSFTEMRTESVDGKTVADMVTELVNSTAAVMLNERPDLKIVYGLHALSVSSQLGSIAKTDPRLKILWEDCGEFPYRVSAPFNPEKDREFTEALLEMKNPKGLLIKCMLLQNWKDFVHQSGPYILGCNGEGMQAHDIALTAPMWRHYEAMWQEKGTIAYDLLKLIHAKGGKNTELSIAAQLNGPLHWPAVLATRMFWSTEEDYSVILKRALLSGALNTYR